MKLISTRTAFALLALATATAASAADWAGHFTTLDANKDGYIGPADTANEPKLKMDPTPPFSAVDKDNNNRLSERVERLREGARRLRYAAEVLTLPEITAVRRASAQHPAGSAGAATSMWTRTLHHARSERARRDSDLDILKR